MLLKVGEASSENAGSYKCEAIINEIKLEKDFHVQVKGMYNFNLYKDIPESLVNLKIMNCIMLKSHITN